MFLVSACNSHFTKALFDIFVSCLLSFLVPPTCSKQHRFHLRPVLHPGYPTSQERAIQVWWWPRPLTPPSACPRLRGLGLSHGVCGGSVDVFCAESNRPSDNIWSSSHCFTNYLSSLPPPCAASDSAEVWDCQQTVLRFRALEEGSPKTPGLMAFWRQALSPWNPHPQHAARRPLEGRGSLRPGQPALH